MYVSFFPVTVTVHNSIVCSEEYCMFRTVLYVQNSIVCSEQYCMFRTVLYVPSIHTETHAGLHEKCLSVLHDFNQN